MKTIYPNDPCPCGSGKKFKHCCKSKLSIPPEKMELSYWVNYIRENHLEEEKDAFFRMEYEEILKKLTDDDEKMTMRLLNEEKLLFVQGVTSPREHARKVIATAPSLFGARNRLFDTFYVEAAAEFLAQMNGLREEEYMLIRNVLEEQGKKFLEEEHRKESKL